MRKRLVAKGLKNEVFLLLKKGKCLQEKKFRTFALFNRMQ